MGADQGAGDGGIEGDDGGSGGDGFEEGEAEAFDGGW